jgi:hypothetical protein
MSGRAGRYDLISSVAPAAGERDVMIFIDAGMAFEKLPDDRAAQDPEEISGEVAGQTAQGGGDGGGFGSRIGGRRSPFRLPLRRRIAPIVAHTGEVYCAIISGAVGAKSSPGPSVTR